jgi:serine/threonine protein kinase
VKWGDVSYGRLASRRVTSRRVTEAALDTQQVSQRSRLDTMPDESATPVRIVGRYALYGELAAGGMATVHLGRLLGPVGFSRTVAIKRLHEQFAKDPEFVSMFLDEARLCARIRHPNVVPTLDVIAGDRQLLLVMEYVQGESLSRLFRASVARGERVPLKIAVSILSGMLHGLHAAHEAKDEHGQPLGIVHRDVSPQNVLVGADGVARVLDFGVAKAKGRLYTTQDGRVKGKLSYMAPEQLRSDPVDRKSDIFAASIVAWELFAGKRLFESENEGGTITKLLLEPIPHLGSVLPEALVPGSPLAVLDAIVMRGLERDPAKRFDTARDMANQLEEAVHAASVSQVGTWVESVAADVLHARSARVEQIESSSSDVGRPMADVITKLTSDADVTKTRDRSSSKLIEGMPAISSADLLSNANVPVSASRMPVITRDPWPRRAAFLLVLVVGGGFALFAFFARVGRDTPRAAATAPTPPAVVSVASPLPTPTATQEPSVPDTTQQVAAPSAADAAAAAATPATTTRSSPSPGPPPPKTQTHPPPQVKPAATVDCRDPYTRDSLGRKIYKIECL